MGSAQLGAARQDAQLMSEQMSKAWLDFLEAETAVQPVLLVLEDLHWGDFGTVRFIDTALRARSKRPWMVLALARPEVFEVFPRLWADRQNVQEIRLKELGKKAGERLVRQVLGDSVGADTVERLVELADGNAFYLEELIRAVAEGKGQGKGQGTTGTLPETVLAMVESRLARLPIEARRVLRTASVFGEVCWEGGVGALMGGFLGPAGVAEWLAWLVEQEMLGVRLHSRFPGQHELAFRHALLREGAYATFTEEDRRLEHRHAGEWLEQHGEGDPMVLAAHFERGGEGARAASYYLRAAEQAFHVLDLDGAIARAGLGLGCAPPQELRLALLGLRCEVSSARLHLIGAVMADAEELLRAAPRGSIPWAQGMLAYLVGMMMAGRIDDLVAALEVMRTVDVAPEAIGRAALTFLVGTVMLDNLGQVAAGTALEERFTAVVGPTGDREPLARFWWNVTLGMRAFHASQDPWQALRHCDAIEIILGAIGGGIHALTLQLVRGMSYWFLGASAAATVALAGATAADEALGLASSLRRFSLSWLRADGGELDEARDLATELSEDGRAHHDPLKEGRGRWVLGEVLRRRGELDAADRELAAALAMATALERPGVLGSLSALRLAQGRAIEAREVAEDAVATAEAIGGCGLFRGAFVRLARAEALHATGDLDAALRAIAEARARLHAAADKIADPAYRASFLEGVPENGRTLALARAWLGEPAPDA